METTFVRIETEADGEKSTNRSYKHTALSAGPKEFVVSYVVWLTEHFFLFLILSLAGFNCYLLLRSSNL